jgi:hypothetical protein
LEAEHTIGRSPRADLHIDSPHVSLQHATLRWTGDVWEVKDLGSLNGTYLNGRRLEAGKDYVVSRGDELAFGDADQKWQVSDDAPPRVMVVPIGRGDPVVLTGDILGIPSRDEPIATIYRGADGRWWLERGEAPLSVLSNRDVFAVAGSKWRFACPEIISATQQTNTLTRLEDLSLHFSVSLDEEHVELRGESPKRVVPLGSRGHNYLLLTLARQRLADAERGLADTACGWMLQDQVIEWLKTSAQQLNLDVHRIRVQFAEAGVIGAANIIERRQRARQLRIGVGHLVVDRL